jgi:hypothetical protein
MAQGEGNIVQCIIIVELRGSCWPEGEIVVERHLVYFQTDFMLAIGHGDGYSETYAVKDVDGVVSIRQYQLAIDGRRPAPVAETKGRRQRDS